jgi:hypothetical protein
MRQHRIQVENSKKHTPISIANNIRPSMWSEFAGLRPTTSRSIVSYSVHGSLWVKSQICKNGVFEKPLCASWLRVKEEMCLKKEDNHLQPIKNLQFRRHQRNSSRRDNQTPVQFVNIASRNWHKAENSWVQFKVIVVLLAHNQLELAALKIRVS